ncbi:YciI family protein [Phenylobacterium sp.]|uniref:YciI family protein n=1 Tax=Phenylobacterium sp. TaxID=1871053 RepID=UPI002DE523D4|nr:YciI family protein [Phenylobacterium sp.]
MQYLLMLHAEESQWARFPADEQARHMAAYGAFTQALADEGRLVASGRLALSDTAQTVRTKGGKAVVMDGPFAETKEQVAGFYLIEAEDAQAAAAWAARCPASGHGVVEVRPLWTTAA